MLSYKPINNPILGSGLQSISGAEFIARLIRSLISIALIVGSLYFVFTFLTGAIDWIRSGSDKVEYQNAKDKLSRGITGVVLLFFTFAIIQLLETFFDISIMSIDISSLYLNN